MKAVGENFAYDAESGWKSDCLKSRAVVEAGVDVIQLLSEPFWEDDRLEFGAAAKRRVHVDYVFAESSWK